jgi:hypothetical protein
VPAQRQQRGRLEPGEAEVEPGPVEHRPRKLEDPRPARLRELREPGAARKPEAEQLRGLVEGLAGRVVERVAEHPVVADRPHVDEHRVPTRNEQREIRESGPVGLELRGEQVTLEVVHADRGHAPRIGEAARQGRPDQQCADEAGPGRVGDAVDPGRRGRLARRTFGIARRRRGDVREQQPEHRREPAHVVARGELGHDATPELVQVGLGINPVREQAGAPVVDGDGRVVARRFYAEDPHLHPIRRVRRARGAVSAPDPQSFDFPGRHP